MNTDELLPAAFTDALYLSSLRCHTLLTLPPPPAPGPLLKGKAGSGVGGEAMVPQNCQAGGLALMFSNPSGLRGSGGNSLDFKAPGFDFGFIAAYSTPLVLNYLITT